MLVYRCLQGQRKLKDLESGSYKETRIVEQVNSAFQQDQLDGLHFTEDIKTVSPPVSNQSQWLSYSTAVERFSETFLAETSYASSAESTRRYFFSHYLEISRRCLRSAHLSLTPVRCGEVVVVV